MGPLLVVHQQPIKYLPPDQKKASTPIKKKKIKTKQKQNKKKKRFLLVPTLKPQIEWLMTKKNLFMFFLLVLNSVCLCVWEKKKKKKKGVKRFFPKDQINSQCFSPSPMFILLSTPRSREPHNQNNLYLAS